MKNFPEFCIEILNEKSKIFEKSIFSKIEIFKKSKNRKFSIFIKDLNECKIRIWKKFHLKKYFSEKSVFEKIQVDITSSDLNEFWIGQKILKAETFLLNLIPTFMGLRPI